MTMTKIHDLAFEIEGDTITLQQGHIEPAYVELHRIHFDLIAGELGLPVLSASAEVIKRRFQTVIDRLDTLACTQHYREDLIDRASLGLEFLTELDAILDLGHEFLVDLSPTDNQQTPKTEPVQQNLIGEQ